MAGGMHMSSVDMGAGSEHIEGFAIKEGKNRVVQFERDMTAFHAAVAERLEWVYDHHDQRLEVSSQVTTYVIPGRLYTLTSKSGYVCRFWLGSNFNRLFFITRVAEARNPAETIFHYTFAGANAAGWCINFQQVDDKPETSIWGTVNAPRSLIVPSEGVHEADITDEGGFWAIDISMMVQSLIRTAQRKGLKSSDSLPSPL